MINRPFEALPASAISKEQALEKAHEHVMRLVSAVARGYHWINEDSAGSTPDGGWVFQLRIGVDPESLSSKALGTVTVYPDGTVETEHGDEQILAAVSAVSTDRKSHAQPRKAMRRILEAGPKQLTETT